ncbi:hypothetical protein EVAR_90928_1 [Eumeta japonica]|uniref:RNase H type-1 domain-containing protein n=1 Tax=Eumeta variegata TaxID=151549 RepID=A0A4C2AFT3_EUMVA|nr:hypothetical protein EVAR_90928_1 [Eumeta japonica]
MVSLDIEGAFDNAWWPALKAQLLVHNCPVNPLACRSNLLESRSDSTRELGELGVYVQAFADDVVLMFSGQSVSMIEEEANHALAHVHRWGVRNVEGLARAAGDVGSESEIVRTIYITVIEPTVLYASCAWAPATRKLGVRKMLDAVQRSVVLRHAGLHAQCPHSALILARLLLDIRTRVFRRLASPCARARDRVRERRDLDSPDGGPSRSSSGRRRTPTEAVLRASRCGPDRVAGREETWYDAPARSLLHATPSLAGGIDRPEDHHPLAQEARRDISEIVAEGRAVRLFWVRAHAGIAGNERADDLARRAALTKRRQRTMISFRCRTPKGDQGGEPGRVAATIRRGKHW